MGEILEFPSEQTQALAFLGRQLRQLLEAKGADSQLIEFAVNQLTNTYAQMADSEQYSFSVELPGRLDSAEAEALHCQINSGLEGVRKENHSLLVNLMAQLVLAQVRLFQHERKD